LRVDDDRLRRLDAATTAPAWPNACTQAPGSWQNRVIPSVNRNPARPPQALPNNKTQRALEAVCRALIASESRLTQLDQATGDGDLGINLARAARAMEAALPTYPLDNLPETLRQLALTLQDVLAGSSGPLYGVFLLRAAASLQTGSSVATAITEACQAISKLGGAAAGDRTMLDALLPFADALTKEQNLERAVVSAEKAAQATAQMLPRRGRASYLGKRALGSPDPGAIAVAIWLRALVDSLQRP
jgi:dihydroxyacetone kinase